MSGPVDSINLHPSDPTEFSTSAGECWYRTGIGALVRRNSTLVFDLLDDDTGEREPIELVLENDGLYHWRDREGNGHWCLFRADTPTHIYLTGNWRSSDGDEGVSIFIWPKSNEEVTEAEEEPVQVQRAPKVVRKATRKATKKKPKAPKKPGRKLASKPKKRR
jgi:hypothetical protein